MKKNLEGIYETDYPVRGKKSEAGQWDDTVQRMSIQAGKKGTFCFQNS